MTPVSPEQASGRPVDRRADIWALGVVLFEMLTGRRLFTGETASEVLASVIKDEPDWSSLPTSTPPGLRRLLRWCLTKDPKERLQHVGDARILLGDTRAEGSEPQGARDTIISLEVGCESSQCGRWSTAGTVEHTARVAV